MASDAERLEILKLVEAGKITPDEARHLLTELNASRPATGPRRWPPG